MATQPKCAKRGMRARRDRVAGRAGIGFMTGGAAVGLTLCREIVEAHGGTLEVARRPGGGVSVTLWLPPFQGLRASVEPESIQTP